MLTTIPFDRIKALECADQWALARNQQYLNFHGLGGDCTNFASQCVLAGSGGVENHTPVYGWYYHSAYDRSASWTGVEFFHRFMTTNTGPGPFARESALGEVQIGDIIQLGGVSQRYYHTLVVVESAITPTLHNVKVSAHTNDVSHKPLDQYAFQVMRCIHMLGVRRWA